MHGKFNKTLLNKHIYLVLLRSSCANNGLIEKIFDMNRNYYFLDCESERQEEGEIMKEEKIKEPPQLVTTQSWTSSIAQNNNL
jgi:hypothetical protein